MKKNALLVTVLALLALGLIACGAPATTAPGGATSAPPANTTAPSGNVNPPSNQPSQPVRGGTLRVGLNSDLTTMDPHLSTAFVDRIVYQSIYQPLVRLDKDLTLKPELASKWEYTDSTTLVFTLQKGVKFHDGTDFDAAAVKANFDRMMDPNTKSLRASEISSVKEVQVVDATTVKLILKAPNAALLATLSDRAGMMISPAAIQKYGADLKQHPVGTGPFEFVEWVQNDHLSVKKFAGYWEKGADGQPLPYLDGVTYTGVVDPTVRLTALKTGTLDYIDGIAPKDIPSMKSSKDPVFDQVNGLGYQELDVNNARAPFDKVEVRQAVAWALDRDAIATNVLFGSVAPGEGPIPPSSWAYDPVVNMYKHDVNKAKDLLAKAGVATPVKFDCMIVNSPDSVLIGQAIKEQLADAGFDMNIVLLDFPTALAKSTAKDYTCFQIGWSGRPDPDGNVYSFLYSTGPNNTEGYKNAQVDKLLDQARATTDQAQRKSLYTEALKIAVSEVNYPYLWWTTDIKLYSPKVNGYVHVPDGMIRTKEMWMAKGTQ